MVRVVLHRVGEDTAVGLWQLRVDCVAVGPWQLRVVVQHVGGHIAVGLWQLREVLRHPALCMWHGHGVCRAARYTRWGSSMPCASMGRLPLAGEQCQARNERLVRQPAAAHALKGQDVLQRVVVLLECLIGEAATVQRLGVAAVQAQARCGRPTALRYNSKFKRHCAMVL